MKLTLAYKQTILLYPCYEAETLEHADTANTKRHTHSKYHILNDVRVHTSQRHRARLSIRFGSRRLDSQMPLNPKAYSGSLSG